MTSAVPSFIRIDHRSLANLLGSLPQATMVGLFARTIPAMRKTENPYYGKVVKLVQLQAILGASYASAVNRRRLKEGAAAGMTEVPHFNPEPRRWGRKSFQRSAISGQRNRSALVEHDGRLYLNIQRQRISRVEYQLAKSGKPIAAEVLAPWLQLPSESSRQRLRKPVIVRDYALENILQLRMRGKIWVIEKRSRKR